jgi:hypothetical protein
VIVFAKGVLAAKMCKHRGISGFLASEKVALGTEIRKRYGLEAAQVILGHASADVTQIYAERDLQKAVEIMREVG